MASSLESLGCDEALDLGSVVSVRRDIKGWSQYVRVEMYVTLNTVISLVVKNDSRLGVWLGLGVLL